jgi:Cu+-exporting ATPase
MSDTRIELALPVVGMTCASCHTRVDDVLKAIPGVSEVEVQESAHRVRVVYDPSNATLKDLVRALEGMGYLVMNSELTLEVGGASQGFELGPVEHALNSLPGVEDVRVNPRTNTARVRYVSSALSLEAMQAALREAGYDAEEHRDAEQSERAHGNRFPWGLRRARTNR